MLTSMGTVKNSYKIVAENLKERDHLWDLDTDSKADLKETDYEGMNGI